MPGDYALGDALLGSIDKEVEAAVVGAKQGNDVQQAH